jgi:hypothetical protein
MTGAKSSPWILVLPSTKLKTGANAFSSMKMKSLAIIAYFARGTEIPLLTAIWGFRPSF